VAWTQEVTVLLGDVAVRLLQGRTVTVSRRPRRWSDLFCSPVAPTSSLLLPPLSGGPAPSGFAFPAGAVALRGAAGSHSDSARPAWAPGVARGEDLDRAGLPNQGWEPQACLDFCVYRASGGCQLPLGENKAVEVLLESQEKSQGQRPLGDSQRF
jgi:hypothetical protein